MGPLGSGKTTTTIQHLQELCVTHPADAQGYRRSRNVAIRNTYPDLETTTIPDFREVFTDDIGDFKWSNPPRFNAEIPLPDGTIALIEWWFLAMDKEEDVKKLRGFQATFGWLNETKELPKSAFDMLDSRIGRYPRRQDLGDYYHGIVGDTNSPDEDHWIAQAWESPPEGWKIFRQPGAVIWRNGKWEMNPLAENVNNLPKGYYKALIQGKKKDWIEVNVANQFGSIRDGKPVHPDFSMDIHVSRVPLEKNPRSTVIYGIDFGRTPAAVELQKVDLGKGRIQVRVLSELVTEDMAALGFGKILRDVCNEKHDEYTDLAFYGDPSGESQAQTRDESPFDMLAAAGIEAEPAWTNDPVIRQNSLDSLLTQIYEGHPAILIDPSCKTLIKGLHSGYHFRRLKVSGTDRYHEKPEKNKWSHVVEALHYGLMGAGMADHLIGFQGGETSEVEREPDFEGWFPDNVGV